VLLAQRMAPGRQTPPQAPLTQALAHVVGSPHWPSLPHTSRSVYVAQDFVPGLQMPPQAPATQAVGHSVGGSHWLLLPQV